MLKTVTYPALFICISCLLFGCDRPAADAQIVGTWMAPNFDSTEEFTFNADHTVVCSGESLGRHNVFFKGTWLFGAKRILIREDGKLHIMNIVDLQINQLSIRESEDRIVVYKRIK